MPFGLRSAPEISQQRMVDALEGLEGISVTADDILVYGVGDDIESASKDHEIRLRKLIERCTESGLKIYKEKIKLRLGEIPYIGHIIT